MAMAARVDASSCRSIGDAADRHHHAAARQGGDMHLEHLGGPLRSEHVGSGARSDHRATAQQQHVVGDARGLGEIVEDEHDAAPGLRHAAQAIENIDLMRRVEVGERFVGEQPVGLAGQDTSEAGDGPANGARCGTRPSATTSRTATFQCTDASCGR
jgi:hypothetical protein